MSKKSESIFAPHYRGLSIALITLITIAAFDQTAVMSVMPTITSSLGASSGAGYTLSFTAVTAASIVAMVAGGMLADSRGALRTLRGSAIVFAVGLLISVFSQTMPLFLFSRVIQGIGSGAVIVAIYAIIALVYPASLQPQMFAAFAGAWVVPTLVGPGMAGIITEQLSWHWLFAMTALAGVLVFPLLPRPAEPVTRESEDTNKTRMLLAALLVAVASFPISIAGDQGFWGILIFAVGTAFIMIAVRPLLPPGTLRAERGLPSLIVARMLFDAFFGLEALIPLLLAERDQLPPTLTGLALTGTGITWFLGAQIQSSTREYPLPSILLFSSALLVFATCGVAISSASGASWIWIVAFWTLTGIGVGYSYPRVNSLALLLAPEGKEGFVGSALQVSGMTGMTIAIAGATLIHRLVPLSTGAAFGVVYLVAAILPIGIFLLRPRLTGLAAPHATVKAAPAKAESSESSEGWESSGSSEHSESQSNSGSQSS